uniref:Endoplasmic reticulum transmembrane protein n=1 Tax=Steinernema glaseri TaxID=37863 RepID=A0A1I8ACG0_9BILA
MTIQWTVVAATLYVEIVAVLVLLLPWIRPTLWNKFFKSRAMSAISRFATVYSYVGISILVLLFFDAIREVRKYSDSQIIERSSHMADADALMHMRLFRAQRNLYISGFALLLFLIIKRICGLIIRGAQLEAASEAAIKQAESANKVAKDLMAASSGEDTELVDKLKRQIKELGQELKESVDEKELMQERLINLREEYDAAASALSLQNAGGDKKSD